ncbi:ABC transporter ATP-binding protein [Rossellomorea vietnamensis]|uniref:ABC transporter ATP-binding protein n=1 Tax=Rossellomorea vietnamensis TaxID=218284 RepID=A0A5D4P2B5_9BACI|nr:ABC transporter ATP-binding protein [Rossellomorea vietnamensis]TYS19866.1 ABC transporter ATP-binding protein [Rossellomorea vietnamensis]
MTILKVDIEQGGYEAGKSLIHNVAFSISSGSILGMIGSNGAGKSTTIKGMLGLLPFMEGETDIAEDVTYSYIPERPIYYDELTLWEHIDFVGSVEKIPQNIYKQRGEELLKKYRLFDHAHQFPSTFSKGMQQKGMIVLALLTEPQLLIIDEPFIGLDPNATQLMLRSLEEERSRGAGILMCTHVLDTAQRICDEFVVIDQGTMLASGPLEKVLKECGAEGGSLYDCIPDEEREGSE